MVAIPTWLLGRHVTAITITGQTVAADGTLSTSGSARSLVGRLDEITFNQENETEEIQALDKRAKNPVIVSSGSSFTFIEILRSNDATVTPTNILADVGQLFDYILVSCTRGGRIWAGYFVIKSYQESIRRGKSTGQLTVETVDVSTANPTYT